MPASRIPYPTSELLAVGPQRLYTGRNLDHIAFPLGGIGTGSVSLGGWGQLRDWEIRNRPAKGASIPNAFFAVRVKDGKQPPRVKTLQGPAGGNVIGGGHSAPTAAGEGLPHFRECAFRGEYPIAQVVLADEDFPITAKLTAFNPFIPLNDRDSGLPVAVMMYEITNIGKKKLEVSVLGNLTNTIGGEEGRVNEAKTACPLTGLMLSTTGHEPDDPAFGTMTLCTPCEDAWVWPQWSDDRVLKFWEAIAWDEAFPPTKKGASSTGTVGVDLTLKPGESALVPFIIAWHFPTFEHWASCEDCTPARWKNWYATQWTDAWDAASYLWDNFERLYGDTVRFHDALFSSTLPTQALEAISANISILKTTTCIRLEDGTFYGFEGCSDNCGCCEGSCTHVWNYAQALPYLFPQLQRSMREADWANSMLDDGFVCFRMPLPLGTKGTDGFHPAADGQMGTVIQVYREWLISGDDEWLRGIWPATKKALEFAWKYWDADKDGLMEGMQHNTYDMEFWGANTMMGSLYLGALRAAEEIARHLGEDDKAAEYHDLFERGSAASDEKLFNGEYYEQIVNPKANKPWPKHLRDLCMGGGGPDDKFPAWPKWQFGKGCLSDQLIGEWYAAMLGLGHLYQRPNVHNTLQSIFKYNFKPDLSDHFCSLRVFAMNEEAGLLIASWPLGERPGYAFWFADEVWCGIEYQVASHMIYEGLVAEGLSIVKGVRDRHTGDQRNPWDEFECGHHYSRSMASYGLLTALSGFSYSAPERRIGFAPRVNEDDFECFFSVGSGWGTYSQEIGKKKTVLTVQVEHGSLDLLEVDAAVKGGEKVTATLDGEKVTATLRRSKGGVKVLLGEGVRVADGQELRITL